METANSTFSSRHKFFAFITIGLLVAAATGVLVWKTSTPSATSSADAGPMIVSKTPNAVNASDETGIATGKADASITYSSSAMAKRSTNRQDLMQQYTNDPLLPPNAFAGSLTTAENNSDNATNGTGRADSAIGPATGIQETTAVESMVPETIIATSGVATPATSRTDSPLPPRPQDGTTPQFTSQPQQTTPSVSEPSEEPEFSITTSSPQDGDEVTEEPAQGTTSGDSPTDIITETNGPLLPGTDSGEPTPSDSPTTQSQQPALQ